MRQAVEAQVLNPHCELGEHGLRQILSDVIQEVRRSVDQDIDGAEILHSLLTASWLQSLLKVYECLQRYRRDSPAPALDYASGLSLQLLIDIRALPGCSEDAKELYSLLRQPHLQALLSAHDTVAQKDYEPVLPPMPDDLPDDEEATRTVCLVKNKQPLLRGRQRVGLLRASSPGARSSRGGLRSHWDTLRHLTQQRLHRGQSPAAGSLESLWCSVRRGSYPPGEALSRAAAARPYPPALFKPASSCQALSRCRVCYADLLWERSPNRSAPSVYGSVMIDDIVEELDSGDEEHAGGPGNARAPVPSAPVPSARQWTVSPPFYSSDYLQPGLPPRLRSQSPRIHTAPPSPMRPRRVVDLPPVELAKQESLDELRTTVQLAACSMESSTKDIKLLGEKMAAATERMSETVQDNSQALVLLTQVVDRLQTLLVASRPEIKTPRPAERGGAPKKPPERPSLTHQSGCSFPSLPSSSSSSLSSLHDATSTSQGTSCLSVSCRASPQTTPKTRSTPSPQKKPAEPQASKRLLTNGLLDEAKEAPHAGKGGRSKQRKKRRKKAA